MRSGRNTFKHSSTDTCNSTEICDLILNMATPGNSDHNFILFYKEVIAEFAVSM